MAILLAIGATEAAVLLLRPREGLIAPAPVSAESYFSPTEIERARDFRAPQLWLYGGVVLIEGAVLAWLVVRPPRRLRGRSRRPVVAAAMAGAFVSVALQAAPLPVQAVMRERAKDVGLVTQSYEGWAADLAKSWAIGAVLAGAGAGGAIALMRRLPRSWWLPGAAIVVGFGAASVYAGPVVLDPLFNRFDELPAGRTRDDVLELARRAGVEADKVLVVDASRRTTAANAYVTGLGSTKRVVLYDTLLDNFTPRELRLVVAHELGHVHHRDVPRGLLFLALVAPFGLLAVREVVGALDRSDAAHPGPGTVPALAAALAIVATPVTILSNQLSRDVERRADQFSLELTRDPDGFISFERKIALRNVADPDPPRWQTWLLSTHPPVVERIGLAEALRRR
jgi:STE24 endopeptidase